MIVHISVHTVAFFSSSSFEPTTLASSCGAATPTTSTSVKPKKVLRWTAQSVHWERWEISSNKRSWIMLTHFQTLHQGFSDLICKVPHLIFRQGQRSATSGNKQMPFNKFAYKCPQLFACLTEAAPTFDSRSVTCSVLLVLLEYFIFNLMNLTAFYASVNIVPLFSRQNKHI